MFEDKAFEIDERSQEYKLLHPNADSNKLQKKLLQEHFEELEEVSEDEVSEDENESVPSDPEGIESGSELEDDKPEKEKPNSKKQRKGGKQRQPRMFAAKDETAAEAFKRNKTLSATAEVPLAERVASQPASAGPRRLGGAREITFTVGSKGNRQMDYAGGFNSGSRGRGRGTRAGGRGRRGRGRQGRR